MRLNQKLIYQMLEKKRIQSVDAEHVQRRQQQELMSLKQLQQRQLSYLNHYDQLFRYVNLWLLKQGYTLTKHEPHQVLKSICLLHCPDVDIQTLIQHRHHLKKGLLKNSDSECWEELVFCLENLKLRL
jgi:exonuclease VII large subunit